MSCHALGTKGTRELPESLRNFDSGQKAWERRLKSEQAGGNMVSTLVQIGQQRTLKMFADWTDRIAAGELPSAPRRAQGIERQRCHHAVGLGRPQGLSPRFGDEGPTHPTVNANGLIYGALELSAESGPPHWSQIRSTRAGIADRGENRIILVEAFA